MPIDTSVRRSPGWWLDRLGAELMDSQRRRRLNLLDAWFSGNPPLPKGAEGLREAYQEFQREARSNFAELIVEALRERMTPLGIRTSADGDETGDAEAWRLWQRAGLDVESAEVHRMMLSLGEAFVIVGPVDAMTRAPTVTAEDPRHVVVERDPVGGQRVLAGLKVVRDDLDDVERAYLYLPGQLAVAVRPLPKLGAVSSWNVRSWEWDEGASSALPDGMMPVVAFSNLRGRGEFESHLDLLARINHMILQRMVIATMQAFRQRAVSGLPTTYPTGHPRAGQEIDYTGVFVADPGAFWQLPESAKMWESGQVDLTPILSSVRADLEHLAAVTRTTLSSLMPGGANQSAEGASLQREGLTFKVEDRQVRCGPPWSQVISNMFRWAGDERADLDYLGLIWAPAERYSLAERLDAASKAVSAGVPWRTRMRMAGYAPAEIDRMESERAEDALRQQMLTGADPAGA